MKRAQSPRSRFWAGALCGLLTGWPAIGLMLWVFALAAKWHSSSPLLSSYWALGVGLVAFIAAFPVTGFALGIACAFCWHPVAGAKQLSRWKLGFLALFFAPVLLTGWAALCFVTALFPLMALPFQSGIEVGGDWWKRERWRHFAGWANDYERENGDQAKTP